MIAWLAPLSGGLLIFCLRIGDVSFGTLRVVFLVRGLKLLAALMAVGEATVYLLAIARVLKGDLTVPLIVGYATGYAAGTAVGITLEKWLAFGSVLVRVISAKQGLAMRQDLLEKHFGVTLLKAEGRSGDVHLLFINARRRRATELLEHVQAIDPDAFVTVDSVDTAIGGHLPVYPRVAGVRK